MPERQDGLTDKEATDQDKRINWNPNVLKGSETGPSLERSEVLLGAVMGLQDMEPRLRSIAESIDSEEEARALNKVIALLGDRVSELARELGPDLEPAIKARDAKELELAERFGSSEDTIGYPPGMSKEEIAAIEAKTQAGVKAGENIDVTDSLSDAAKANVIKRQQGMNRPQG